MNNFHSIPIKLLLFCMAFFGLQRAIAQPVISGPDTTCVGVPTSYTVSPPGPHSWVITPIGHGDIVSGNGTDAVIVVFTQPGAKTILALNSSFVPGDKNVYVLPAPTLSVTTDREVGCRNMAIDSGLVGDHYEYGNSMEEDGNCLKACANSIVRYYAHHSPGEITWAVSGPTLLQNWGDSIEVQWGVAGSGGTVTAMLDSRCGPVYQTLCVEVIESPTAQFAIAPATTPAVNFSVCAETPVSFRDISIGSTLSPIVDWYWDFGDGTTSTQQHPTHRYNSAGNYTVSLVVRNACNCTDTFQVTATVYADPGPEIECPSVVCAGKKATYTTPASCGTYNWSITGGSIEDGGGTGDNFVTVLWDVIPDGLGYVSLQTPSCGGLCPATTVVKVAVVHSEAEITGPTDICAGETYEYSLPLWAGTQWNWGVINQPSAIQGIRNDHKVHLKFDNPGTYQVHGTYLNGIAQCGGDDLLSVTVKTPATIVGDRTACAGSTVSYVLSNSASADWTLQTPSGTQTGSGASFNASFPVAGDYVLYVGGNYCAPAFAITVTDAAPGVSGIDGVELVCLNTPYSYSVTGTEPGTVLVWEATGGTVSPPSGSGTVTVTWTASSGLQLKAWHQQTNAPHCAGPAHTLDVSVDPMNPTITGPATVCANSYSEYTGNYTSGDSYFWTITPSDAGSITSEEAVYDEEIQVIWNHFASNTPATINLEVKKCGQTINRTYNVTINPSPAPAFTILPSTACPGKVTLAVTPGAAQYTWYIPGVFTGEGGHEMEIEFPANTGNGGVNYTVYVTASGAAPGASCPPLGQVSDDIQINPGPVVYASVDGPTNLCGGSTTLVGTAVGDGLGSPTFTWMRNGVSFDGPNLYPNSSTSTAGAYHVEVIASNGCTASSNILTLTSDNCGGGGCTPADPDPTLDYEEECGVITLTPSMNTPNISWRYSVPPDAGVNTTTPYYNRAGKYNITYIENWPSPYCDKETTIEVTVPAMPHFYADIRCGASGEYEVTFWDRSSTIDGYDVTDVIWDITLIGGGSANPNYGTVDGFTSDMGEDESYTIRQTIWVNSLPYCFKDSVITLPKQPSVSINANPLAICTELPIDFSAVLNPVNTVVASYNWDFGSLAENRLPDPQSSFRVDAATNYTIVLEIQDIYGCTADDNLQVNIRPNELEGRILGAAIVCAGTPVTLLYDNTGAGTPISPYEWHWGGNEGGPGSTLAATESGAYWVKVFDAFGCRLITDQEEVTIIPMPQANIRGNANACVGEPFSLDGFAGPGIDYAWRVNSGSVFSTNTSVDIPNPTAGTLTYSLLLSYTDPVTSTACSSSDQHIVQVNNAPSAPSIVGPVLVNCNSYEITLTGYHANPGNFTWSNGSSGAVNTVYQGGVYRIWYTDANGCRSHADVNVPRAPEALAAYMPEGCYELCEDQTDILTLYGPPGVSFNSWQWFRNMSGGSGGANSLVSPYPAPPFGYYQLYMDNGLCDYTTPGLSITDRECYEWCNHHNNGNFICNNSIPGRFDFTVGFDPMGMDGTATLSAENGVIFPSVTPFTFTHTGNLSLQYNSMVFPEPAIEVVILLVEYEDGSYCSRKMTLSMPSCDFDPQRGEHSNTVTGNGNTERILGDIAVRNSISVYPNPTALSATVRYDYGAAEGARSMDVYDIAGRKIGTHQPSASQGEWRIDTREWQAGIYLIRMQSGAQTLHTFKLVVSH